MPSVVRFSVNLGRLGSPAALVGLLLALAGCGSTPTPESAAAPAEKPAAPAMADAPGPPATPVPAARTHAPPPAAPVAASAPEPPRKSLADLAAEAEKKQFDLPTIEPGKLAVAGIRTLRGKHITIYTDVPAAPEVDELPQVFDAAVPLLGQYFGVAPERLADFKLIGSVIREKERFQGVGLYPEDLPPFPHGYSRGSEIWLYDQPSAYYRRHLMLHEGVHAFAHRLLGGSGPPWYMEGIAELLGTHLWKDGQLKLASMPPTKEEVPYWGRVKIVQDERAAGRGMSLLAIMKYDARAHLKNEPYGWCWAAAAFFDQHPLTQEKFRALRGDTRDRSIDFSKRFYEALQPHWPAINEDWELFTAEIDYGYDISRAAVVRRPAGPLPTGGVTISVAADRDWQSSGITLEAGKTYALTASGRFQVAREQVPWISEAGGVTIRYYQGRPLGLLLAAVSSEPPLSPTPLLLPHAIGLSGEITPTTAGTLYLRVNDSPADLGDNAGEVAVTIREK